MYITKKDLKTFAELDAFVMGAMEDCGGLEADKKIIDYWQDFYSRVSDLRNKAEKSFTKQKDDKEVQKIKRFILKNL